MGLDKHLPKMGAYYDKARDIAAALSQLDDIEIKPNPPQCNMMHVYFRRDQDRLWEALLDITEETKTVLMYGCKRGPIPAYSMNELVIGEAALDLPADQISALFADLMHRAT
jgi:hypothetical protein